ncbi:hypothetical protein QEN19_000433 [Hanseniaspora menglaensis]
MEEFLNGASSKAFDIAMKSSISFATSYAMKRMTRLIDEQVNKTITTVVASAGSNDNRTDKLFKMKKIRNRIEIKMSILNTALDQILIIGGSKGHVGAEMCNNCNKLLVPIIKDLENWINEDSESIEKAMMLLEKDIDTVVRYLQLSLQTVTGLQDVNYDSKIKENNSSNLSSSILVKSALIIADSSNTNIFECSYNELTRFHENTAVWKEVCRKCNVSFECFNNYNNKLIIKQNFNDDLYHNLEEESKLEIEYELNKFEKIFYIDDSSTIGFGDNGSPCLVFKCHNEKWVSISPYTAYEDTTSEDENSQNEEEDFESVAENTIIRHSSIELLSTIIKLLKIQCWEQKTLVNITDDTLEAYIKQGNIITKEEKNTENKINKIAESVDKMNI